MLSLEPQVSHPSSRLKPPNWRDNAEVLGKLFLNRSRPRRRHQFRPLSARFQACRPQECQPPWERHTSKTSSAACHPSQYPCHLVRSSRRMGQASPANYRVICAACSHRTPTLPDSLPAGKPQPPPYQTPPRLLSNCSSTETYVSYVPGDSPVAGTPTRVQCPRRSHR